MTATEVKARILPLLDEVADTAASLPEAFTADPADRLIYATAVETGWSLVTKDSRLLDYAYPRPIAIW